jgi:succinate-semialdehyde dehydrogenase/glutarate-semialdehyde dehydrogenase
VKDPPKTGGPTFQSPLVRHLSGYEAGAFLDPRSGATFSVTNPANGERLAELPSYGGVETTRMVEAAARVLESPPSLEARAGWLRAIARALLSHKEELSRIITLENGKPIAEAVGEVEYAAGFYGVASESRRLAPHTLTARPKGLTWTVHARPAGVAGLITPWNFPLAMLAKKLSGALGAGAPSVIKPAEKTPLTTIALFHLLDELGLPAGMVNLVFGDAPAIGRVLCEHPAVRVISFTGSTGVGKLLATQAAQHVKRLALELGGNAPFVVFEDADLGGAAEQLMATKFRCSGQTCVSANRIYVQASVLEAFTELVAARVEKLTVGPGLDPKSEVGPLIDQAAVAKVERLIEDAVGKGAQRVVGGPARTGRGGGTFFSPTVRSGVRVGMAILRVEA